jgi:adenosylmethionine-8-amino-7-oxononanoate aminotransferase
VKVALKRSCRYWQFKNEKRRIFLSLKNAYHGDTISAVSVGGTNYSIQGLNIYYLTATLQCFLTVIDVITEKME